MVEPFLYQKIAESIRERILTGELKPGQRLPPVRQMAAQWSCTIGTVQHAYRELIRQGILVSRAGQGTRVVEKLPEVESTPLRWATLIHRAEAFLLEVLTTGHKPDEVEQAVRLALDRWRAIEQKPALSPEHLLRFVGSHDVAITWIATHFPEIVPQYSINLSFSGSLRGLIALAEGQADIAGSHLWDEEGDDYNLPFVRRVLPGRRVALVTLAHRQLGLILSPGNQSRISSLEDLTQPGLRFVNRQAGSGTRVWLDASLRKMNIAPQQIKGYNQEKMTHSQVAQAIAEGQADVGLGLEASARAYGLGFVSLVQERYDLVIPDESMRSLAVRTLCDWLGTDEAKKSIASLGGYTTFATGELLWIE